MNSNLFGVLVSLVGFSGSAVASVDVAVHADGRKEEVVDPRKDSKGDWMGTIDGRRQRLVPGEIVVLVDDEGTETSLLPTLVDAPATDVQLAAIEVLADARNEAWFEACEQLVRPPARGVMEALVELAKSGKKDVPARAVYALTRMRTAESSVAAARAVLDTKKAKTRRDMVAPLFSVREILRRANAAEIVLEGLEDKDALVRVGFALVAAPDVERAREVLVTDGLKNSDHHVREMAAVELGRRGDSSGLQVLISMLARDEMPGMEDDPETGRRFLVREQVDVCEILGALGGEKAVAALERAKEKSPHEPVRQAAEKALVSKT